MKLPDGTHLAYVVTHEAWYSRGHGLPDRDPSIGVMASAEGSGGGVAWEFSIRAVPLSGSPSLKLGMFWDCFDAFGQMPEFFEGLAGIGNGTLDDIRALLDQLGAVDETARTSPYRDRDDVAASDVITEALRLAADGAPTEAEARAFRHALAARGNEVRP